MLAGLVRRPGEPTFAAAVGSYLGCDPPSSALETDTLILIGDAEDSTPVAHRWRGTVKTSRHVLGMKTYPWRLARFRRAFATSWICRGDRELFG